MSSRPNAVVCDPDSMSALAILACLEVGWWWYCFGVVLRVNFGVGVGGVRLWVSVGVGLGVVEVGVRSVVGVGV